MCAPPPLPPHTQVVGSIQKTNDLDVHIALLSAPSYAMEVKNKYYSRTKTPSQVIREHIDMFGATPSLPSLSTHFSLLT